MTANKVYQPALIGGKILGVQMTIQNPTDSSVTASSNNGVYYTFDGHDYQILSLDGVTIASGGTKVITADKVQALTPTTDIKIMFDTAGLEGCIIEADVAWGV